MVDAVFNNFNFFINLKLTKEVKNINFEEMGNSLDWEFMMLDSVQDSLNKVKDDDEANEE